MKKIFEHKFIYITGVILILLGCVRFLFGTLLFLLTSIGLCSPSENLLSGIGGFCELMSVLKIFMTFNIMAYGNIIVICMLLLVIIGVGCIFLYLKNNGKSYIKNPFLILGILYLLINLYSLASNYYYYYFHYQNDLENVRNLQQEIIKTREVYKKQ